jgi:hypothetical protein
MVGTQAFRDLDSASIQWGEDSSPKSKSNKIRERKRGKTKQNKL